MLRLTLLALALATAPPLAAAPAWPGTENNAPALGGHDPVAYFSGTPGTSAAGATPAMGKPAFTATHAGATFRFVNPTNRDAFIARPERYAPQFNGYCAWAASQGRLAAPDPKLFKIVEGKLYMNCSKSAETQWLADVPGNIAKATIFWDAQP